MAGVAEPLAAATVANGPFSAMARAQYAALSRMRWSVFRNTVRSTRGAIELGARILTTLIFSVIGLALAVGLGGAAYAMVSHGALKFLPILFWAVFVFWQMIPITIASFQQHFDMAGLLRFPVGFSTFFVLNLLFGLVDASTIVGAFCCLGIWVGIVSARPDLFAWAAVALFTFVSFNVLLVRAIFAWIERWLAQRRTREIVMAIFFLFTLSLQLLNPAFGVVKYESPKNAADEAVAQQRQATLMPWLRRANAVQRWLPPGLASNMVSEPGEHRQLQAVQSLAILGVFVIATGGALAARLRAEYRGENLGEAPGIKKAEKRTGRWLIDGSGPIAAVFEKELRTVMRAIPLLYQIASPLVVVFLLAGMKRSGSGMAKFHFPMGLLLSLAYVMLGFTQMIYNNLGGDGPGIQMLFLSPTPIRTVILAKNLFHAGLYAVVALLVSVVACWRFGVPPPDAIAASVAWVLFALPLHLAVGNLFSITMPYKINLGRMGRHKGSQANALLSILVQLGAGIVGAGIFAACAWFGRLWLAVPIFLLLAAGSVVTWMRVLGKVDQLANERRDDLIATLMKAE